MGCFFQNREIFAVATALLLAAFVAGTVGLFRSRGGASQNLRFFRFAEIAFLALGFATLSAALFLRGFALTRFPAGNVFEIFQWLGWCAVVSVVFLRAVWALRVPAVFAAGGAAVLCVVGFLNAPAWDVAPPVPAGGESNPWVGVHVALATIGYAGFTAAVIGWCAYLLQNFALRGRRTHRFFSKLPDLESLDRIAGRMCAVGVFFLGCGLIFGVATLLCGGHLGSTLAAYKISFSALVFCGFSLLVFLRRSRKISAKLCARLGVFVFFISIIFLGGIACVHNFSEKRESREAHAEPEGQISPFPQTSENLPPGENEIFLAKEEKASAAEAAKEERVAP